MAREKPDDKRHQIVGRVLRAAREEHELTQIDLADGLQRLQAFVSKYERGDRSLTLVQFLDICDKLGDDPVRLMRKIVKEIGTAAKE